MTATDELRRLLDERGVEYDTAATVISVAVATFWHDRDGYPCSAIEGADDIPSGEVSVQACITPEQAVAATLGPRTCHVESMHGYTDHFASTRYSVELSCHTLEDWPDSEPPEYCPWCGAKVVE